MIVTLNEVQRTCQKALSAAGAPPGLDDDGANAAAWLESRGLSALAGLAAALDRWSDDPSASLVTETAPHAFDAAGRSAVFVGPGLIEAAAAATGPEATARLEIAALSDPQFLLPAADALSTSGWAFGIAWGAAGRPPHTGGSAEADNGTALRGDWSLMPEGRFDAVILCRRAGPAPDQPKLPVACDPAELQARHMATLAGGLSVEDALWRKIARYAHRALVPASAESRARGAGAMTSDNE